MKEKNNHTNPQGKANPSDTGLNKGGIKGANEKVTDLNYKAQLANEYTQGVDEPADHLQNNPNRNPNKTKLDKPAYGGS
jgi:hypothetical protein